MFADMAAFPAGSGLAASLFFHFCLMRLALAAPFSGAVSSLSLHSAETTWRAAPSACPHALCFHLTCCVSCLLSLPPHLHAPSTQGSYNSAPSSEDVNQASPMPTHPLSLFICSFNEFSIQLQVSVSNGKKNHYCV